ncbi:hypothetical protein PSACC_03206 [Paramicrosporidium saccamoebae]|uniref:Protein farnesyltransferase/geranylgeranyltransferase type-1 subunit alpha n=1 Tax=Paramicrosporidium saccamoebae TaxID=1246581 RepID=A0A2H9TGS7_9FUNG|nr:hypothetical protein PSACC_03206 [Paramicrosporidium saccamoebae]
MADWENVTLPVHVHTAVHTIVPIAYSEEYKKAMAYFSQYRRRLVRALNIDPHQELAFIRQYTVERPKNYQLWYSLHYSNLRRHREQMVSMIETPEVLDAELADLALVLLEEPKNIHGWQYRQWLIRRFDAWDGELSFLDEMLRGDPYNNSAWNHRLFLLKSRPNLLALKQEVGFIKEILTIDHLSNRSVLNYVNGLLVNAHADIQVALHNVLESFDLLESFRSTYMTA